MRERQALSPEEMEALLAHAGGASGAPHGMRESEAPGKPDRALLQEFAHFLLTGALQALWGAGRVRRLEVEPATDMPLPFAALRAVHLTGGLTGVLAIGVRLPAGAGEAPGMDGAEADALASALAADLPARIGRLLGVAVTADRRAVAALDTGSGLTPGPDGFGFLGRADDGQSGVWELYIGFSPGLAGTVSALLQGDDGIEPASASSGWAHEQAPEGERASFPSASSRGSLSGPIRPASFPALQGKEPDGTERADVDLLGDLVLRLTAEVGRARVQLQDLLQWRPGTVVVLDRLAGEMVDVLVNGKPVAKGEILVVEDFFTVKITDIVSPLDRVRGLNRG